MQDAVSLEEYFRGGQSGAAHHAPTHNAGTHARAPVQLTASLFLISFLQMWLVRQQVAAAVPGSLPPYGGINRGLTPGTDLDLSWLFMSVKNDPADQSLLPFPFFPPPFPITLPFFLNYFLTFKRMYISTLLFLNPRKCIIIKHNFYPF